MKIKPILMLLALLCSITSLTPAFAANKVFVKYETVSDQATQTIRKNLIKSGAAGDVASLINEKITLKYSLKVVFGGDDGPLYDPETKEIFIPYSFLEEVKERFKKALYSETGISAEQATTDALMHTLLHELGHALIPMFDFPILAKEEDAVDSLATVMLIEYFEQGQEIALSAADLFDLESNDIDMFTEEDFWDEHALDKQRFYNTLCMVYGSEPDKYSYIVDKVGFSDNRADLCIEEYEKISNSWISLLNKQRKLNGNQAIK